MNHSEVPVDSPLSLEHEGFGLLHAVIDRKKTARVLIVLKKFQLVFRLLPIRFDICLGSRF